ncbi:unnamed protein product [Lactuca saligna]|uniref:SWI/SNF complex subunit SWI3D n=1 Tax=Lactuca saligna TaxID=75948 RepID=A0AA36EFL4_LACSI|nr:unnamed protein product [Lactuca saligna]
MEEKHNSPATATETALQSSAEPPSSRRRGGGLKRKASNISNSITSTPPPSSSKRQTREKPSPVLFPPIHNGPCTRARLQPNYTDSTAFWDAVIVNGEGEGSMLSTPVAAKVEEELIARKEAWEALELKIEAEYEDLKSRDANAHVAPISSGWFSWTKLHPLEERALPSFFNGKLENRTPEIYMEIRNSIMKKFHTNPNTQIEEKDLSEISVGELDAKKEVMEFLDYWGLINYHPFPETDLPTSMADADQESEEAEKAEKVNSLIQKLYEFEVEQLCTPAVPRSSFATPAVTSRLPESIIADESLQPEGPSVEYHCNSCAADCSRKRYHCQKQADYDLCTECFNAGKFDSDMSPSNFILMEPADAAVTSSGKWTDQETLLLLEALELFSENWNEIAEHVATKTKAQCILHFVQMPIEDTFRDCDDEDDDDASQNQKEKDLKKDESCNENEEKKEVDENDEKIEGDVDGISDSVDVKETEESKALVENDDLSPMEVSESVIPGNLKDTQENGVDIAVKALREAFEVVGSLSSIDEKLSFADAGNPVMAMAAFLTRLVDPNIATATARNSLKSVSSGATGLQLSARHSFIIEDPVDEKKKPEERDDVHEAVEQEDLKEKNDSDKEGINGSEKEKELVVADEKKEDGVVTTEVVVSKKGKNTRRKKGKEGKESVVVEESNEQKSEAENSSSSKKVSEDSGESVPKDEEMSEKTEPHEPNNDNTSMAENSGEAEAKECKNVKKKKQAPEAETKNDQNIHNMTRAAVTAISAAAVKAKLLADREEDQIRKLATSLIEKQLQKLETKLAFFTEMDGVVARARDQLERSKQRLYHERAQIIAARLGMSSATASARPIPQPPRAGMSFPNPTQRPPNPNPNPHPSPNPMTNPMAMTPPQRPPPSRPMTIAPTPPPPPPPTVAGNPSSVGMK